MDLSIPVIAGLHLGGNVVFFWGFFRFANQYVFGVESKRVEEKEPNNEMEKEIKQIERELKRM